MIESILRRKTVVSDRAQWEARLKGALPKIMEVLSSEHGFVSVRYLWGIAGEGEMAQITTWQTAEDCLRFVREGGAATVGAVEDRALATASHPDGAWVRANYELLES